MSNILTTFKSDAAALLTRGYNFVRGLGGRIARQVEARQELLSKVMETANYVQSVGATFVLNCGATRLLDIADAIFAPMAPTPAPALVVARRNPMRFPVIRNENNLG